MKTFLFAVCLLFLRENLPAQATTSNLWQPSLGHEQIPIWPGTPPDLIATNAHEFAAARTNLIAGRPWTSVENVSLPTLTVYSPRTANTGVTIVVFPGGGYNILAIDLEGTEVCEWLAAHGITGVLLKYRVPGSGSHWDSRLKLQLEPKFPTALEDAQRTVGLVRLHAADWHLNPHKIGVLGFSAGGHLVANISTHFRQRAYPPVDAADQLSCRPDFAVACYPGHMLEHTTNDFQLNPMLPVTADVPPTFLLQAEDDPVDEVQNSLVYYLALKEAGVPTELHLYAHGGHGFGLRQTALPITHWPELLHTWLTTIGMIPR